LSRSLAHRPSSPTLKDKPVVSLAPLGRLTGLHLRCRGFRAAKTGEKYLWWLLSGIEDFCNLFWDNDYLKNCSEQIYEKSALNSACGRICVEMVKKGFTTKGMVDWVKIREWKCPKESKNL